MFRAAPISMIAVLLTATLGVGNFARADLPLDVPVREPVRASSARALITTDANGPALGQTTTMPSVFADGGAGSPNTDGGAIAPKAEVVALMAGDPAPFAGLLVTENRFKSYLDQQRLLEEASLKLQVRDTAIQEMAKQEAIDAERSWLDRNAFWLGLTLGVVTTTTAAVYVVHTLK